MRPGDLEGQGIYPAASIQDFALESPFTFDSDRSASRGSYVTISVANENLMNFLVVLTLLHVCIYNHFENTPLSYHAISL